MALRQALEERTSVGEVVVGRVVADPRAPRDFTEAQDADTALGEEFVRSDEQSGAEIAVVVFRRC